MPIQIGKWLTPIISCPDADLRLICFPFAGGNAWSYHSLAKKLTGLEIFSLALPGRMGRMDEPPITSLPDLINILIEEWTPFLQEKPFAFFGHSMGALISFALAHQLKEQSSLSPIHLIASGTAAPSMRETRPLHLLPESEFVLEIKKFNGTPPEVFDHPELLDLILPTLRADFALCESFLEQEVGILDCPMTIFGGKQDPGTTEEQLKGWQHVTTGSFQLKMFSGDHFFLNHHEEELAKIILENLHLSEGGGLNG